MKEIIKCVFARYLAVMDLVCSMLLYEQESTPTVNPGVLQLNKLYTRTNKRFRLKRFQIFFEVSSDLVNSWWNNRILFQLFDSGSEKSQGVFFCLSVGLNCCKLYEKMKSKSVLKARKISKGMHQQVIHDMQQYCLITDSLWFTKSCS